MADVKNVVTLGIGAAPGGLVWFMTGGLESSTTPAVTLSSTGTVNSPRATGAARSPIATGTALSPNATGTVKTDITG